MTLCKGSRAATMMKHPLQTGWRLYLHQKSNDVPWDKQMTELIRVDTVEDFWATVDHLQAASALSNGHAYYFFKDGIFPAWEDPLNQGGWQLNYQAEMGAIDVAWLEALLCLIGAESFGPQQSLVNGACVLNRARKFKLGLWCGARMSESQGNAIKAVLRKRFNEAMKTASDKAIVEGQDTRQ